MSQTMPYGTWTSPITAELIVSKTVRLGGLSLDGDALYWLESRPAEKGRTVLVRRTVDGETQDVTPPPFNVRTRVHEYGGGSYLVDGGEVYFSNFSDQRLYRVRSGAEPQPLTAELPLRYADCVMDRARHRLICVCEDHATPNEEPLNSLASIDLETGKVQTLCLNHDFFASPCLSPDGARLAWLTWEHPRMPWDGTELWVAHIGPDGTLGDVACVAGGPAESIFQPEWSPEGVLTFVSDRSGWWNLYQLREGQLQALSPMEAEFGQPQWVFGMRTYAFASEHEIVCAYIQNGDDYLARLDLHTGDLITVPTPFTAITLYAVEQGQVFFLGVAPDRQAALLRLSLGSSALDSIKETGDIDVDAAYFSTPEALAFPTFDGSMAYGIFYPPHNPDFAAPEGEKPPLLVISHGGPTGATSSALSLSIQYWTSRGFAVFDVNYGGSTGYGRPYRERLNGQWGIVDVEDCIHGARYLVEQGRVDGARLAIRGGSAGGYTTLAALTFHDVFHAGASHYGIGDLEALARDTHKFESRYLDGLIGSYPAQAALYQARSPLYHTEQLSCPVIFFQGAEDPVVLPNQAQAMVAALQGKGIPVAYLEFEGEAHGFRQAANIRRALEAELYFYGCIFGFMPADTIEPVTIENL